MHFQITLFENCFMKACKQNLKLLLLCLLVTACDDLTNQKIEKRPSAWAQAIEMEGTPNLFVLSSNLYRSAQPTALGMLNLKKIGIKTILNLRSFNSDRKEIGLSGLAYEHIYMKAWHPEVKEVVRFLQIVSDPKRTPVLVHCMHGSDRTGMISAIYRIAIQGWSKEDAIKEMREGSYGFHKIYSNLATWILKLDIDKIKQQAGINDLLIVNPKPHQAN